MNARAEAGRAEPVGRVMVSAGLVVALFDACFWKADSWGLSEAVFFGGLSLLVLLNRSGWAKRRTTRAMLVLILGAAGANVIEPGFCNTLVWLVLAVALAGDTFFAAVDEPWGRFLSQVVAVARAPGRVLWLAGTLGRGAFGGEARGFGWLLRGGFLLAPTLLLTLLFGSLLASGNAIFGAWTQSSFNALERLVDPWRMTLWLSIAVPALALLRPVAIGPRWWSWALRLPRWGEGPSTPAAVLSSVLALAALNLLFLGANLADAAFLWGHGALPAGVTYSQFVHQGTEFLVATVLLSALVLATIFQQSLAVVRTPALKRLGLLWVAQNLFLILSVALRLKHYIEAYDMSVARLGLVIFLAMVASGFGLLWGKILWDRSLSWLIGGCLLAIFATLYLTQFLNLAGWTADYNVARWEKDRSRNLDACYLRELGPAAWPALAEAHRVDSSVALTVRSSAGYKLAPVIEDKFDLEHWREFSLRAWWNRGAMGNSRGE